jgi:hypothetical protein
MDAEASILKLPLTWQDVTAIRDDVLDPTQNLPSPWKFREFCGIM